MRRRTKIIATIGPASDSEATLVALIEAGMDVARIGLAHEDLDRHLERYDRIRKASVEADRPVGILVDLPGPKVRAGRFPESGVVLGEGDRIRLTPGFSASTAEVVEVGYDRIVHDVQVGDRLIFGDGTVAIEVQDKTDRDVLATVCNGGHLQGRPGIHIPSDRLRIASPTPEDLRLLDAFVERGVDMVAVSFVRSAHDIRRVGVEPHPRGPLIVAKIETRAAVQNLEGI
ncbi:MAG TPA: pyruvate kinase, partial [Acidimicrobiales bacterium]|nr:pyruvate kinase [Acidimicrobiales bacterium]